MQPRACKLPCRHSLCQVGQRHIYELGYPRTLPRCVCLFDCAVITHIFLRFPPASHFSLAKVTNLGARNSGLQDKLEQFAGVDLRVTEESQFLKKKTDLLARAIHWTMLLLESVESNPLIIFPSPLPPSLASTHANTHARLHRRIIVADGTTRTAGQHDHGDSGAHRL